MTKKRKIERARGRGEIKRGKDGMKRKKELAVERYRNKMRRKRGLLNKHMKIVCMYHKHFV